MTTLIFAGALIGFVIGMTGVGGGSLMTPFLMWYGIPAHLAVGTDLLFAAITKSSGIVAHARQGSVRWQAVAALAVTSLPASIITLYILQRYFGHAQNYADIMKLCLGLMLFSTGLALLIKTLLRKTQQQITSTIINRGHIIKLMCVGLPLGLLVTLSSVGAGVIGTMLLMVILPLLPSRDIVGTDLAHAVPLTFVAGFGHYLMLDSVDFQLLFALLLGSIPTVYIGGRCAQLIADRILRLGLACLLMMIGALYTVSYF